ncbi:MAG: ABC transporter substrate-binding protein [OCS116 cluster bacterium]|uniref:ABC transporter permease n=1 Tax=OCS116 cluster bacterium TaxID=2030921 RepID=A0A2A4Z3L7_9PROT|nr:ABC transporter substrate-binding protein [OCS116 cluster bacterium]
MKNRLLTKSLTTVVASALLAGSALFASTVMAADMKRVAISTIVEVPALVATKDGLIQGLKEGGYEVGKNLEIDYQSANGKMDTQLQIAKKFIGDRPDLLLPITTPTSQAMIAGNHDIPVVFTTVTDPVKAQLITQYIQPGGNVTGVSDAAPIAAQLELFKRIVPGLKKIGFIYNPGLDSAAASLAWMQEEGAKMGIEVVESPSPTGNEVLAATKRLIGKVDAIYVPNDTTVIAGLAAIVKIGQETKTPVFTGEPSDVASGPVASVGVNYFEIGRMGGLMAAQVLDGKSPGEIDAIIAYKTMDKFVIAVNLAAAEKMGVTIPQDIIDSAQDVFK